jgi:ferrous iron transport protein A
VLSHLSDLRTGETAVIDSFTDEETSLKLLEMGCLPGEKVKVEKIAPRGDPMAIEVAGYLLSLRKSEAATVLVRSNRHP